MLEKFEDIVSLYDHIEANALDYDDYKIADLFRSLRDLKIDEKQLEDAEIAGWELNLFNFTLIEGKIGPMIMRTNENGDIMEYPSLNMLNDKCCDYLVSRFNLTSNPKLKSRYGHILWFSPKKIGKFAQIAIESYLDLIKIYEEKDILEPQKHYGHDVLESIKNAYFLARNVNDRHLKK